MTDRTEAATYRIAPEDKAKFKEIADKFGFSQKEAMQRFIAAFETQADRERLVDSKSELESFDQYIESLQRLFYSAIDAKHNSRESARLAVEKEMRSKDVIIAEYQAKMTDMEQVCKDADASKTAAEESVKQLEKTIQEYEIRTNDLQATIADKDMLIHTLQNAGQANERKAAEYDKLSTDLNDALKQVAEIKAEMERKELEHQKQMLELERQKLKEIAEYQQQYKKMMDGVQAAAAEAKEEPKAEPKKPKTRASRKKNESSVDPQQTTLADLQK